jgi:hypothetical protein
MKTIIANEIRELFGGEGIKPFKPVAYYDFHMDCIRVELRDCSFTEKRIDELVTLLEDNYPAGNRIEVAGLTIKGVKHLFIEAGLPLEGILSITAILDELVKKHPDLAEMAIYKIINQMDLSVNMDERSCVAA